MANRLILARNAIDYPTGRITIPMSDVPTVGGRRIKQIASSPNVWLYTNE